MPGSQHKYRVTKYVGQWYSCCCGGNRRKHITAVLKYLRANGYEPE